MGVKYLLSDALEANSLNNIMAQDYHFTSAFRDHY